MNNLLQNLHDEWINEEQILEFLQNEGVPADSEWSDYELLKYVISQGHTYIAKLLIEKGYRLNKTYDSGDYTPLHIAVDREDVEIVKILLAKGASMEAKYLEKTALENAILHGHREIIDLLLLKISWTEDFQLSAKNELNSLHFACFRDDLAATENALRYGISPNIPIPITSSHWPSYTPLHLAVTLMNSDMVKILLNHRADVAAKDSKGLTPLHMVSIKPYRWDIVDLILAAHEKCSGYINPKDWRGFSHFHAACYRNNVKVVEGFLQHGVEINSKIDHEHLLVWSGFTPLHFAARNGGVETVKLLLEYGADVSIKDNLGMTALNFAFHEGQDEIIRLILEAHISSHVDINPIDNMGFSCFHAACMRDDISVVQTYLENGVEVNHTTNLDSFYPGYTPLHFAVVNKRVELVELLLAHGARTDLGDALGDTPLHLAVDCEYEKIVDILLRNGADVNVKSEFDVTPLHIAVRVNDRLDITKSLLDNKADINSIASQKLYTPLHFAALKKQFKMIDLLLTRGTDVHARAKDGKSILHTLALEESEINSDMDLMESYSKAINALLESGCDVNFQDSLGCTPLHDACTSGNPLYAYALLQNGADVNIEDHEKKTPSSYCTDDLQYISHILYCHIEKLAIVNFHISQKNQFFYVKFKERKMSGNKHEDEFHRNCVSELNRMKDVKIDSYTSLYDIIFKSSQKMTMHVKNNRLRQIVMSKDLGKHYLFYGYLIKLQFKKGLDREVLVKPAKNYLKHLIGLSIPDLCLETILKYLTNEHLKCFIENCDF